MKRIYRSLGEDNAEQNVDMTPLIDMVFILLIFFIVTTVFVKDKGMDIERPTQSSPGKVAKNNLLIAITADGNIRAGGQSIGINSLRAYIKSRLGMADTPVVILADKHASIEIFAEVMDECRKGGAKTISLATEQKK